MAVLPTVVELRRRLGAGGDRGELSELSGIRHLPGPGSAVMLLADAATGTVWAPHRDGILSHGEMERAARFVFLQLGETQAGAYVLLRKVLRRATPTSTIHVRIRTGEPGKSSIDGVEFSLSHTGSIVLIGLGDLPLGVNVEKVPEEWAAQQVGSSFHPWEAAELLGLPADEHPGAFVCVWVRKEALFKIIGTGLSHDISRDYADTGTVPGTPVPGLRIRDVVPPGLPGHRTALCTTAAVVIPQRQMLSGPANEWPARNRPVTKRKPRPRRPGHPDYLLPLPASMCRSHDPKARECDRPTSPSTGGGR